MFEILRNKIKDKLATISEIQEVQDYPTLEFGGFPVAVIKSTRNESSFETTKENLRVYVFTVYIMQDIASQGMKKARGIVEATVDSILDAFDKDQNLEAVGLQTALPADKTVMKSQPLMTDIGTTDDEKFAVAKLDIKVSISINIT